MSRSNDQSNQQPNTPSESQNSLPWIMEIVPSVLAPEAMPPTPRKTSQNDLADALQYAVATGTGIVKATSERQLSQSNSIEFDSLTKKLKEKRKRLVELQVLHAQLSDPQQAAGTSGEISVLVYGTKLPLKTADSSYNNASPEIAQMIGLIQDHAEVLIEELKSEIAQLKRDAHKTLEQL